MEPLQMNEKTALELPHGWVWTTLGKITTWGSGGTPLKSKSGYYGGDIPWLKIGDLNEGLIFTSEVTITQDGLEKSSAKWVEKGSLLVAMYGSIGKLGIAGINLTTNQAIAFTKLDESLLETKFVFWYIRSIRSELFNQSKGATQKNISQTVLKQIHFPLPPLPEQHCIVTKIEELFTQLDAGVAALQKTQAQVKQYRQSVLKSACKGKLVPTEAELARAEGREYEPADVLLEWILKERRGNSEKYKELTAPDVSGLGELPEGWVWVTYKQIGKWSGGGTPSKSNSSYWNNGTIPWISPKDMKTPKIYETKDEITDVALESSAAKLIPAGSLLFVVRSGILRRTLPVALTQVDATVNQDIKALIPSPIIFAEYLLVCTQALSEDIRTSCMKDGTTVESIEVPALQDYTIPIPPLAEQHRIVAEIERRLSVADAIEKTIVQSLKQAKRLRQSILKKAFEGKLVPQNPNDEPASVLLERIKEEKVKREIEVKNNKKIKSKKKKVNQMENDGVDFKNAIGLHEILKSSAKSLTPKELWQSSKLEIDDFYAELKTEVERGRIIERRPDDSAVFLEVGE